MSPMPSAESAALPIMFTRSAASSANAAPMLRPTVAPVFTVIQLQNQICAWA
jgi:hypothetical protein